MNGAARYPTSVARKLNIIILPPFSGRVRIGLLHGSLHQYVVILAIVENNITTIVIELTDEYQERVQKSGENNI